MTNLTGTTPTPRPTSPALELERKPWQTSTAPKFIGLFLWVVYFDQLARGTLAVGGLALSVLGALAAALLCTLLLYEGPALWGFKTGKSLAILGTSTFGVTGSRWITGALIGIAQVVWFAVATFYAIDMTFRGLVSCRLMDPKALEPMHLGGLVLPNVVFLATALAWSYAAALVGHYLVQVIGALMNVYPIFIALALAAAMLSTLAGVPQFRPLEVEPVIAESLRPGAWRAFTMMIELVFGFFAPAAALAADWGAVNRSERDVRLGGWFGVALASWTVATLALLTVAGAQASFPTPAGLAGVGGRRGDGLGHSFREAVLLGIGGTRGGTIFLVLGLGSLAPTCYAAYLFGQRFAAAWPRIKRIRWTLLGTTAACFLIVFGRAGHLETIFTLMGAAFAPLVAALTADYLRQRGAWAGARQGVNGPGVAAWALGLAVGLVPIVSEAVGWEAGTRFQPAAVFAYVTAFVAYRVLAVLGAESPLQPAHEPASGPGLGTDVLPPAGSR